MSNKETVRKIEEAWSRNATDDLDQYFAPDFQAHSNVPGMPPGLAGAKMAHGMVTQFLSDRQTEIVDLLEDGDKVALRVRVRGNNNNGVPWIGAQANGQPYDFESWSLYTFRDGKVVEHVGINDVYLFGIQAGAIQPPVPA
jgi:ketosteroid isomerase-like protein